MSDSYHGVFSLMSSDAISRRGRLTAPVTTKSHGEKLLALVVPPQELNVIVISDNDIVWADMASLVGCTTATQGPTLQRLLKEADPYRGKNTE